VAVVAFSRSGHSFDAKSEGRDLERERERDDDRERKS
jgi:hypothetical protein